MGFLHPVPVSSFEGGGGSRAGDDGEGIKTEFEGRKAGYPGEDLGMG